LGPIPNPQSPIPNPQSPFCEINNILNIKINNSFILNLLFLKNNFEN